MSSTVKKALEALTKDVEKDLIDHGTGLLEDVGKGLRIYLYKARGIECAPTIAAVASDNSGPSSTIPKIEPAKRPEDKTPEAQI